jgi:hypothetical protein
MESLASNAAIEFNRQRGFTVTGDGKPKLTQFGAVFPILASADYRGCGKAWSAVNDQGQVIALRYMDMGQARVRDLSFSEHRTRSRAELAEVGRVMSGMCSCGEFCLF